MNRALSGTLLVLLLVPTVASAQTTTPTAEERFERAVVTDASEVVHETLPGTDVTITKQHVTVTILEGTDKGRTVSFENDYVPVAAGETVYVRHTLNGFDPETWSISDSYRIPILVGLLLVFLVLTFVFGGFQGIRALASLVGSILLIFAILIPGLYAGHSPILVSIAVAALIIVVGSYVTHGVNRTTTAAVIGMLATVLITGLAAYIVIHLAHLSGFTTEENAYLNFGTGGRIDMIGLLFGGIMIGLLGVLYDISIGQAIAVEELLHAGTHLTRPQVYLRGLRIGREHIGALINTLAIAYVGTSLPLLLLLHETTASLAYVLNSEQFATEIIRILIGSIGIILTVPLTTAIATYFIRAHNPRTGHVH